MDTSHTSSLPIAAPAMNQSLPMLLLRVREAVLLALRPVLRELDLTEQKARVLLVLGEAETIDMGALADASCLQPPSLSRILPKLRASGWIESSRPDVDMRRVQVALSPAGRGLVTRLREALREAHGGTKQQIGEAHAQALAAELMAALAALGDPMLASASTMEDGVVA